MKNKAITVTGNQMTEVGEADELNILLSSSNSPDYLGSFSLNDFIRFIDENKPKSISLYIENMHGKTIVFVLEHLLTRKYKPSIYNYVIHKFGRPRIIIIKFLYFK